MRPPSNTHPASRPVSRLVLDVDDAPFDDAYEGKVQQALGHAAKAIISNDLNKLKDLTGFNRTKSLIPKDYLGSIPLAPSLTGMGLVAPSSSLLHLAVRVGNLDAALTLTHLGCPVGAVDSRGDTPLLLSLTFCPDAAETMLKEGKARNLRYTHRKTGRGVLHEIIASPGAPASAGSGGRGASPLRRLPLIEYLVVEYGVNPKERDASGLTPLEHAQNNYLQLGAEADSIIAFLEDPPKSRSQANLAQGRKAWEFAKHPFCRFFLPVVLAATHSLMYLIDTVARGTDFPTLYNETNSSSSSGSSNTTAPVEYNPVLVQYPRKNEQLYHSFVAYGRRADVASLPFFNDIFHHLALEWPSTTSVLAAKVLTIVFGLILGIVVFVTIVHVILRDLFKLRIFGADVPVSPDEENDFSELRGEDGDASGGNGVMNPLASNHPPGSPGLGGDNSRYQVHDDPVVGHPVPSGASASSRKELGCWDLAMSSSPLVASSRGRGRLVLAFYGAFVGVYCGGLVFNLMLDQGAFSVGASDVERLRMKSRIHFTDGTPVRLCDLWYIRFGICAMLAPLVYVTLLDEMFQMLSAQLFVPSTWYSRFGNNSVQLSWGRIRIPLMLLGVAVCWAGLLFLFVQDGIAFSFDDLPRTLLPSPHLALNLWVGGMALLFDVLLLLQTWALPELQSLVIVAKPFERKNNDGADVATKLAVSAAQSNAAVGTSAADDDRAAKRLKLLAGVHHVVDMSSAKQNRKLKGKERELARRNANASQRTAGPDEFVVVEVRNAFKVPFTFMRGNLHWFYWMLITVDLVLDVGYVAFYITEIATTANMYPSEADAAKQHRITDSHGDHTADVIYFAVALLPSFLAVVIFLLTLLRNTVWVALCCGRDPVTRHIPAIHEATEETLVTALPWTNDKVALGAIFNRKSVASVNRLELTQAGGGGGGTMLSDGSPRNTAYDAATGPGVIVDVWACAYRDDVVRLGALLDADSNLLNERGGVGIRVRPRRSDDDDAPQTGRSEALMAPGFVLSSDPKAVGEEGEDQWDTELSPRTRATLVAGPNDRIAELLPDGVDDPAYYGATPLHYAILGGARSAVMALLSRGANVRLRSMNGLCAAQELAHIARQESIASLLHSGGGTGGAAGLAGGQDRDPREVSFHSSRRP